MAAPKKEQKRGRGRPRKRADSAAFTVRIDVALYRQLRHYAVEKLPDSFNDVIEAALKEWWNAQPERARYARLASATTDRK